MGLPTLHGIASAAPTSVPRPGRVPFCRVVARQSRNESSSGGWAKTKSALSTNVGAVIPRSRSLLRRVTVRVNVQMTHSHQPRRPETQNMGAPRGRPPRCWSGRGDLNARPPEPHSRPAVHPHLLLSASVRLCPVDDRYFRFLSGPLRSWLWYGLWYGAVRVWGMEVARIVGRLA
jgi:hypothetical protein